MFWELEKPIFGPEKDKWWIRGSKTRKPPEMHHNWPRHMDWPQFGPKIAIKQGKKRQKDKWPGGVYGEFGAIHQVFALSILLGRFVLLVVLLLQRLSAFLLLSSFLSRHRSSPFSLSSASVLGLTLIFFPCRFGFLAFFFSWKSFLFLSVYAHSGPQKSRNFRDKRQQMMHCDLRVRLKVASALRFRAASSEPKTPSFCRISGDLAPSTRKSLAIDRLCDFCALRRWVLTWEIETPSELDLAVLFAFFFCELVDSCYSVLTGVSASAGIVSTFFARWPQS